MSKLVIISGATATGKSELAIEVAKEIGAEVTATQSDLEKRDLADSTRAVSPLEIAPGARVIDTTYMELSEVIAQVVDIARAAHG